MLTSAYAAFATLHMSLNYSNFEANSIMPYVIKPV